MKSQKIHAVLMVILLISLSVSSGAAFLNTYKIKGEFETSPGEWKFYYLQGSEFGKLTIEFDWVKVKEEKPNLNATDLLVQRAKKYVDKPVGIRAEFSNEISTNYMDVDYNLTQIEKIEAGNRNYHTNPYTGELCLYIVYLNGHYRNETNERVDTVLGVSYHASSIAVFRDAVWGYQTGPQVWRREAAVLVHEFGHMMGLVNIGYRSAVNRSYFDPDEHKYDEYHCNNSRCVMYPKIERQMANPVYIANYSTDFCRNCSNDIGALKKVFDGKIILRYFFAAVMIAGVAAAVWVLYTRIWKRRGLAEEKN